MLNNEGKSLGGITVRNLIMIQGLDSRGKSKILCTLWRLGRSLRNVKYPAGVGLVYFASRTSFHRKELFTESPMTFYLSTFPVHTSKRNTQAYSSNHSTCDVNNKANDFCELQRRV